MSRTVAVPDECPPPFCAACTRPYAPHSDIVSTAQDDVGFGDGHYPPVPPSVVLFTRHTIQRRVLWWQRHPDDWVTEWLPMADTYAPLYGRDTSLLLRLDPGLTADDIRVVLRRADRVAHEGNYVISFQLHCCIGTRQRCCEYSRMRCCELTCHHAAAYLLCWLTLPVTMWCGGLCCMTDHVEAYREHNARLYLKRVNAELAARSNPPVRARWGRVQREIAPRRKCFDWTCRGFDTYIILHTHPDLTMSAAAPGSDHDNPAAAAAATAGNQRAARAWSAWPRVQRDAWSWTLLAPAAAPAPDAMVAGGHGVPQPPSAATPQPACFKYGPVLCSHGHVCAPLAPAEWPALYRNRKYGTAVGGGGPVLRCHVCREAVCPRQSGGGATWAHCPACGWGACHRCTLQRVRQVLYQHLVLDAVRHKTGDAADDGDGQYLLPLLPPLVALVADYVVVAEAARRRSPLPLVPTDGATVGVPLSVASLPGAVDPYPLRDHNKPQPASMSR